MPYTVALDAFHGPLDLLLFLVKRNEVDVLDIPIAKVADQFRDYLLVMQNLDVELAGDFVVMAATLMEIKSRMLLPAGAEAPEEEHDDPRRELVKQLLEYRKFKDAAAALEERAEKQGTRLPRHELPEPTATGSPTVKSVELWDLVSAFARLMRETQASQVTTIAVDDTPQHVYESQIKERVAAEKRVAFRSVFSPPFSKPRLLGVFLAVLELIRHRGIGLELEGDEIWLVATPQAADQTSSPITSP
ncbi:MAG TPA: segregation/condensation protein A [Gemmataceae bacterium]|nr:segregation/condensation protein A [Gemmataceae bacterium]